MTFNRIHETMDRRRFLKASAAAGVTVTMPIVKANAATPRKGGVLRVGTGHGSTTDALDPGLFESGFTLGMTYGYNGYLTQVARDGSLEPSVAESWEGSDDAAIWTFHIRKGVEFHNGRTVNANDVVASLNHHRGEGTTSTAAPLLKSITGIKADGDHAVVVKLEGGNADFPFYLTDYHIPVMQASADGTMEWQAGIGCGAYKLDNFEPGVAAHLSKHGNHWDDSVGHVDKVEFIALIDPNARTAALVSGDVDAIDRVDLKTAGHLGRTEGISVHATAGTQHYTFPMRADTPPFDDVNVRRAIKHSVDRQELVDKILFGYGEIGNDVPIGSGQRFFNKDMPQTSYDPAKAKFYLKAAGYSSLDVELSTADAAFLGAVDAAVLIQNSARASGINVNVVREPNDGYWSDVWMKKGWSACYWGGRPVEDMMFSTAYTSGVSWNDTFWGNERFDELMVAARSETDDELRREMYYEMQVILNDEGGALIPMFASYVFAMNDTVGHVGNFSSHWDLDGERFMERWWKTGDIS